VFHIGWQKIDAKLVDQKFVERGSYNVHHSGSSYQVWDYMVEFPGDDGNPVRLVIREKSFELELPEIGGTVPILVNKKRTKADFDLKDPRVSAGARRKARAARQKADDEARFEEKLRGE
jgi:hypothetical protein